MLPKYYPVILVVNDESGLHFKMVRNDDEHTAFCLKFVGPDTALQTIKMLEALYRERMGGDSWDALIRKHEAGMVLV
ncbi:MAG TPA: hypothetical protein VII28_14785 [Puia sp.]